MTTYSVESFEVELYESRCSGSCDIVATYSDSCEILSISCESHVITYSETEFAR